MSEADRPEDATVVREVNAVRRFCMAARRAWLIARTHILWRSRLHALGAGSVLGRCLQVNNPRAVAIGSRVTIMDEFILADLRPLQGDAPKIMLADGCTVMYRFQCNAARLVAIGRNVLIASNVLITDSDHVVEPGGVPVTKSRSLVTRPVRVEDNCWLGQNVVVLKGVTIGHDSIIGANSVVTRDVPPCSVAVGNPARAIKHTGGRLTDASLPIDEVAAKMPLTSATHFGL
ncbi:MAG: acyltransferase [Phycisphaerae bacterium]|nr:acyltransferase [Phycisphaerae bacterium]